MLPLASYHRTFYFVFDWRMCDCRLFCIVYKFILKENERSYGWKVPHFVKSNTQMILKVFNRMRTKCNLCERKLARRHGLQLHWSRRFLSQIERVFSFFRRTKNCRVAKLWCGCIRMQISSFEAVGHLKPYKTLSHWRFYTPDRKKRLYGKTSNILLCVCMRPKRLCPWWKAKAWRYTAVWNSWSFRFEVFACFCYALVVSNNF